MNYVSGSIEMTRRITALARQFPGHLGDAVYQEMAIDLKEMKKRTPVSPTPAQFKAMGRTPPKNLRPGTLRDSGKLDGPEYRGRFIEVTVSFGAPGSGAEAYAAVQHERLDFFHTTGQAKYMESVMNESRPYMAARVARRAHFDRMEKP